MSNPVPAKSCPSLGWTIFWLLVFSPVAVWQGYKAFVYRKACLVGGAEPESRSMVVLVLGVVALVFLVFSVVVTVLAVNTIVSAPNASPSGVLLSAPSWL